MTFYCVGYIPTFIALFSSSLFAVVYADYVKCQLHVMYLLMNRIHNCDVLGGGGCCDLANVSECTE